MPLPENPAIVLPWLLRAQCWRRRSTHDEAVEKMIAARAPAAAVEIFRSPVGANTTLTPGYQTAATAFADSMQVTSAFYRIQADRGFLPARFHTRIGFSPTPPVAVVVPEGSAKSLSVAPL